jgi:nicotinamide phosphoribosyltransferase
MIDENVVSDSDAYKDTHWLGYPKGLNRMYSYGESRINSKYPYVDWFGLDMIVQKHFLQRVTNEMIDEAEEDVILTHGHNYFNRAVWEKVRDLGFLPVTIKAVPEGTRVPIDNVLFTIESSPEYDWFAKTTNFLEGTLMHVWKPTTICTRSGIILDGIKPAFAKSSDIADIILPVAVNDFGYRGASGREDAARSGAAHLVHFVGSDNKAANKAIKDYYGYKGRAKSVWATEHSVATSFGLSQEQEMNYLRHQLTQPPPDAIRSVVIDSKDPDNFIRNVVGSEEMVQRIKELPGRLVLRPDSGKGLVNMCKYSDILGGIFGFSINSKGYKVLNHNIGLLQGDGMDEVTIPELYNEYIKTGWAADNFITGSGGGLLVADATRDTQRFAIKASYGEIDGVPTNFQKDPSSDTTKKSKAGRLKLHKMGRTGYVTLQSSKEEPNQFNAYTDELRTVFKNGEFFPTKFEDILERAKH